MNIWDDSCYSISFKNLSANFNFPCQKFLSSFHATTMRENIPDSTARLIENEKLFSPDVEFEYIMVDDGSKDKTLETLKTFHAKYPDKEGEGDKTRG